VIASASNQLNLTHLCSIYHKIYLLQESLLIFNQALTSLLNLLFMMAL